MKTVERRIRDAIEAWEKLPEEVKHAQILTSLRETKKLTPHPDGCRPVWGAAEIVREMKREEAETHDE